MSLQAEPARPHDLPGALDLLARSGLPDTEVAQGWGHFFVVREDDGRVVGLAGLELYAGQGLLRSVAVDASYRGQRLAEALVDAVMSRARLLGLKHVYLLTTNARDYFARRGFAECDRASVPAGVRESWEFRSGCPETAAVMVRPVG